MNGSMRYQTVETSRSVLEQLHLDDRDHSYFPCRINVVKADEDSVEDRELTLLIDRVYDRKPDLMSANGDLLYNTMARLVAGGKTFPVTVVIRSRQASVASATITISDEVEKAL